MTVSKNLKIRCDNCRETKTWSAQVLRHRKLKSVLENHGYTKKYHGHWKSTTHWCPDCNDREKDTFYVVDGRGDEYLGEIKAWGIVHARRVAWDTFECENMVKKGKPEIAQ